MRRACGRMATMAELDAAGEGKRAKRHCNDLVEIYQREIYAGDPGEVQTT